MGNPVVNWREKWKWSLENQLPCRTGKL